MKTIDVPRRAEALNKVLRQAREENLILRAADGTEFVVVEINDFDREIETTRENKELLKFLTARARDPKCEFLSIRSHVVWGLSKVSDCRINILLPRIRQGIRRKHLGPDQSP